MLRADRKLTLILVLVFLFQCLTMAGAFSNAEDVVVDISIPAINLTLLTITHDSAELVWVSRDNSVQAASYDLYRNDVFLKTITSFTYTDTGLSPQTEYSYYVKAKGSDGKEIADSNVFSITTRQAAEASTLIPPANLSVSDVTDTSVKLTWEAETTTPGAICYIVYSCQTIVNTTIDTSYTVENLTPGTEYTFAVAVQDETGITSDPCSPVTVKTLDAKTTEDNFGEGILRSADPDFQTDRYIIKYKNDRGRDKLNRVLEEKGLRNLKGNKVNHLDVILLDRKINIKDFVKELKDNHLDGDIEYIQPDYQLSLSSDDPLYSSQWGLENAPQAEVNPGGMPMRERLDMLPPHLRDAVERSPELKDFLLSTPQEEIRMRLMGRDAPGGVPPGMLLELANDPVFMDMGNAPSQPAYLCDAGVAGAWEKTTGGGITVGVIDTGADIRHEDLSDNIWANPGEIPGNDIDDDGDGYIDDDNGWNFCDNNNVAYDNAKPSDESHGTHIAGIIAAAKDNGKGIAGAAPSARILPLKVFKNGTAYTSDIINAIKYAESKGVRIINCSWGSAADNPALREAIQASGMLFVCAAGNSGADIDINPAYPAAFDLPNIITVASVNRNGGLSGFSNYGEGSVDVAAPGEGIESALPGNTYGRLDGTSMAAAFVSGEAALLAAQSADLSARELKERMINTSDHLSSLTGKVSGSNKINCTDAVSNVSKANIIQVSGAGNDSAIQNADGFNLFSAPTVEGQFIKVACGGSHTVALKNNGTVWACGDNLHGELGDGTTTNRTTPVQVSGMSGVTSITAGDYHTVALKNDGTVWAWGYNNFGQLGDGTTTNRTTPVQMSGLNGVTTIAAGYFHTVALKNDGTVWAWGYNGDGELGDGTTTNRMVPVQVSGLSGVTAIAAGYFHTVALKNDGTVWAWGYNLYGQVGDGTTTNQTTPVRVRVLSGVTAVAAGNFHTVALKNDGAVWAWGYNNYGQLGDVTTTDRTTPVQVSGLSGVTAITAAGSGHTVALRNDGTVWAWGYNNYGQVGDGTTTNRMVPVQVSGLSGVTAIAAGYFHTVALKNDGTVWAWGYNSYGQLGDGTATSRMTPVQVNGLSEVTAIAVGYDDTVTLENGGTVWAWGYNNYGQVGDGTTINRATPVQVNGLSGVTAIAAGYFYTVAMKNDGTVWAWGYNNLGQLGDGTTTSRTMPVQVSGLSGVTAIAAGNGHTVALKNDGTVWAWGFNGSGRLGDGTTTSRTAPVQVSGLSGVTAITAGDRHTIALKDDGTIWVWGYNFYGQLGDGTTTSRTAPVQVSGLSGVTAIAAGDYHTLALKNNGTVWVWGRNNYGQLGDGTTTDRTTPVQVSGLSGVTAIAARNNHTVALKNGGTVWAWGYNYYGQLGDGTTANRTTPVQVSGMSGVTAIAAGYNHTVAQKDGGTVWAWGYNFYGQLGNGEKGFSELPKWSFGTPVSSHNPITTICTTPCISGEKFSLVLRCQNMSSISDRIFTITYNPSDISSVIDLCRFTYPKEVSVTTINGTDITIIQNDPGAIRFTVSKPIESGKVWSGIVNIISFNPAVSGQVSLTCTIE